MKTIVLATDFSPAALNACNYAADMAKAINANLLLVNIPDVPKYFTDAPPLISPNEILLSAEESLDNLQSGLERKTGKTINIKTEVRIGVFFTELQKLCDEVHPFAVVMGSQGKTNTERIFFGSNSVFAMKRLNWPLLAIPIGAKFSGIKKIGLACDFEKVPDTVPVDEIEIFTRSFNADLFVLNTGTTTKHDPEMIFQSGLAQVMFEGMHPKYEFISNEDIDEGIIDFCEKNNIDMLIIVPRRHTLSEKLIHKSHTKQMVLHSHVPVMALHQ